ncbi:hypothetical protein MMC20_002797 [Loxospora ochrophaea]|nr:hypothetical protein [Loxospora ochrophaea]
MSGHPQALLKRHPLLTPTEFSKYWLHTHARLVIAWALASGCVYYAQIHNLRLSDAGKPPADLHIEDWDGAAEMVFASPTTSSNDDNAQVRAQKTTADDYFRKVIIPDETRFLVDEARKHIKWLEPGTVEGERIVIIEERKVATGVDGKPVVDVAEAMRAWEEWVVKDEESGVQE